MIEKLNYISDDELERLISQVEQEELVAAPPDLMESILEAVVNRKKEFHAYCFRVITSVAAAVALVFLLPELTKGMDLNGAALQRNPEKSEIVRTVPSYEEVMIPVPSKNEVVAVKVIPSKEEVLDDTGFFEKVISGTGDWLKKDSNNE